MDDALRDKLLRIYADSKTIAVVGASADEAKPSFRIPGTCRARATSSGP